ncbi:MAG TPA: TlpA disulfide reductase family protein, partial [Phycisphaerales bacterium]|nr:TlpA disulfide reductase family protein [Phycisphaerales bacterium]
HPLRITAAFDETTVTWVDHEKREVHTRPIRSARGTVTQLIHAARVPEVMSREPLAKELVAPEMFTESSSEADGVACDVVVVRTENKVAATRWWFGKDDILPRRIVKSVQSASGSGTSTVEFLEIKVDDRLREADLRVDIPDGYSAVSADDTPAGRLGLPARTVNQGSASPGSPSTTAGPATGASQGRFDPSDDPSNHRDPDHERPLDLLFKSENGTEFTLSSLRDRPVILCFVASWSLPSRAAIPRIEAARTNFGEAAHVLALTVRERFPDQAGEFIRARGSTARVVPVGDDAATALGIRILPAVVVIDRRGNMVHAVQGMSIDDWDALPERIPRSE